MKLEDFKNGINNIKPDPYMETRLAQNILEAVPKKRSKRRLAIAAVSGFLSLAVLITGLGFGFSTFTKDNSNDELSVLIAYASTGGFLNVGSVNKQEIFYSIHVAPYGDNDAVREAREKYNADRNKIMDQMKKNDGYGTTHYGNDTCYNDAGERSAEIFKVSAGQFALSLNDYSNVETFKVENSNTYGELYFEYDFFGDLAITGTEEDRIEYYHKTAMLLLEEDPPFWGSEFEISGDVLRQSQTNGFYSFSLGKSGKEINLGYILNWEISDELYSAIGNDPNFNLSEIKDTITFTVEFNDGSVKTASLDLYFDSDGYMHFGK